MPTNSKSLNQGRPAHAWSRESTSIALVLISAILASEVALRQPTVAAQEHLPPHHDFTEASTGKGIPTSGALEASFHSYKSEDGTVVVQLREWYKSADEANNALNKLTKRASHVVKQSMKKDAKGHVIGGRVELVFSHGHGGSPEMIIAWTNGATIVRLRSTSLPLLRDFESQYYP